jgi:hypothetical protein
VTGTVVYALVASAVAVAVFLASERIREPGAPAADRPGLFAVAMGLLWPLLLIAVVQCALYAAVRSQTRVRVRPRTSDRVLDLAA